METRSDMQVRIVYAEREKQIECTLSLPVGTSVGVAIEQSNIAQDILPHMLESLHVAIFGRRVQLDTVLCAGDRIEILRPLSAPTLHSRRSTPNF